MFSITTRFAVRLFAAVFCLVACIALSGCMDRAHIADLRESALIAREQFALEAERLAALAADPDQPPAVRHAGATAAADLRSSIASLDAGIEQFNRIFLDDQTPEGMIQTLSQAALPFLPAPLQAPALLLTATGLALARAAQLKKAAGSIAQSIAKAAQKDEEFRSVFARHADTFRSVQTPAAKRIVDEKVRSQFMLRLPL